jgi:hypothetical protein
MVVMESNSLKSLPVPSHVFTRGSPLFALIFAFVLIFATTRARADIISTCDNAAVTEGDDGVVNCTMINLGPDTVIINGVFAFAFPVAGDFSDTIASVDVLGPIPPCGTGDLEDCPAVILFQVFFTTTPAHDDPHPDVGINDVSLILDVEDADTGDFVPGLYGSAAVSVFDKGLTPVVPTDEFPSIPILTKDDYDDSVTSAQDRGLVNSIPEPAPFLLLGTGFLGVIGFIRRRSV